MAYTAKYKQKIEHNSEGKLIVSSKITARFNFREEIPPKDRAVIRKRINSLIGINSLVGIEGISSLLGGEIPQEYLLKGYLADNHINKSLIGLGFNLEYSKDVNFPVEQVRLEAMNHYILTGEKPKEER